MRNITLHISFTICIISLIFATSGFSQAWQHFDSLRTKFQEKQNYDSAAVYAEKSLHIVKEKSGENDTLFANLLGTNMQVNYYRGNYAKAIEYCIKEKDIRKKIQGENHKDYAQTLNNLAILYKSTGNYSAAEPLYLEAKKIWKIAVGIKHQSYASSINNLALLYNEMGNYAAAETLYLEAKNIWKEVVGEKHRDYATTLNNLAALYDDMGNYIAAEPLYLEAKNIWKEVLGSKHLSYAQSLNNLAMLYQSMGNYAAAEPLLIEAKNIRKDALGTKHTDYASTLNNLALLYKTIGNYAAAEILYIEASNIWKEVLGEKHLSYSTSLNNLASLYFAMGNYNQAEPLYVQALSIRKEILGEKHPEFATSLNNLAQLYQTIGSYDKALPPYLEAKKIRKEILGEKHPDYATTLNNLAQLYQSTGKYAEAESMYLECIDILSSSINHNFAFLSEKEKEKYFIKQSGKFSNFYSFSLKRKNENNSITKTVYNNVVKNKGSLLKSSTAMRTAILNSNDTSLLTIYKKWIGLKKELSKLYSTELSKRKKNPAEIAQQANSIEKELVRSSQIFSNNEKLQNANWENIKNNLKEGDASIEFIRFIGSKNKDTIIYCALLITQNSQQPEMIQLFFEKDLERILETNNRNNLSCIKNIYGTSRNSNEQLYNLIWQPIEKFLNGVKTVYYSPDGLLHKISFSSISNGNNHFLCDDYLLHRLSSTAKIAITENINIKNSTTIGIYGGIEYSADTTGQQVWKYLPGTKREADKIDQLFKTKKIDTHFKSGNHATEKDFKEAAGKCFALHIATHGFFYPEPVIINTEKVKDGTQNSSTTAKSFGVWQFLMNKNPLMRSGLVFSGANNVWNQRYGGEGDDGVLTAQEVTQLDLQKTQLVVLSACETGLGDIKGSEGVYGLQRAFKMAGVKFLIMSLWQVPDKETSEFMTKFYDILLDTKDIRKSFNETQFQMRKNYDPFSWGAFILIE